ncbi:UbiA family prenyltransferase [Burkholderia latens]|uniref:UbiA family prenyltransferase n=1 Tax=Burkholderia latens TaxID=488446 RepID=UPI001FC7F496|nr:UbiA family prenyltransferase [Burkholderia latens]
MLALAFLSMSLGASATYIGNDLWDLDNDRRHPRKRNRPFASGVLSINQGIACAALLLTLAFALALAVSAEFTGMFALYLLLTTAYSWRLKSVVLLDVLVLSLLYTYRIVAGAVAAEIMVSRWLCCRPTQTLFRRARAVNERRSTKRDIRIGTLDGCQPTFAEAAASISTASVSRRLHIGRSNTSMRSYRCFFNR